MYMVITFKIFNNEWLLWFKLFNIYQIYNKAHTRVNNVIYVIGTYYYF